MAVVIPAGYGQLTIKWRQVSSAGSLPATVLGVAFEPDMNVYELVVATVDVLVEAITDNWLTEECLWRIGSASPPYASYPVPYSQDGASVADPAGPNVCALIKKVSLEPGRAGRGRIFLPGVSESHVDGDGTLNSAGMLQLGSVCTALNAVVADVDGMTGWVILHDESSPLADTPTFVAQHVPSTITATQRRRLRR